MPDTEILIFSQYAIQGLVRQAEDAGTSGYLLKSSTSSIIPAIEALAQHKYFFNTDPPPDNP